MAGKSEILDPQSKHGLSVHLYFLYGDLNGSFSECFNNGKGFKITLEERGIAAKYLSCKIDSLLHSTMTFPVQHR